MYEFKSSDVLDFANFIGAEIKQKGNELFLKKHFRETLKQGRLSVSARVAIITVILWNWQEILALS